MLILFVPTQLRAQNLFILCWKCSSANLSQLVKQHGRAPEPIAGTRLSVALAPHSNHPSLR